MRPTKEGKNKNEKMERKGSHGEKKRGKKKRVLKGREQKPVPVTNVSLPLDLSLDDFRTTASFSFFSFCELHKSEYSSLN
jgi:hypothetical protein